MKVMSFISLNSKNNIYVCMHVCVFIFIYKNYYEFSLQNYRNLCNSL